MLFIDCQYFSEPIYLSSSGYKMLNLTNNTAVGHPTLMLVLTKYSLVDSENDCHVVYWLRAGSLFVKT